MKEIKKKSLRGKILKAMILLIVLTMVVLGVNIILRMVGMMKEIHNGNESLGSQISSITSETMENEITAHMQDIATGQANTADAEFAKFRDTVELLASDAEYLYANSDSYGRYMVNPPDPANNGELSLHMTYSANTNINDSAIIDEAGLLGNARQTLLDAHAGNKAMAACYYATESGLFIEADYSSAAKCDENGNPLNYEASERPWYIGTKEAKKTYFTNIVRESTGKRVGMMCGSPIYYDDQFMGVACAGMYLDDLDEMVSSTEIGENGIAAIINNEGKLLFSSDTAGVLTVTDENANTDMRGDTNPGFAGMVSEAVAGNTGVRNFTLNDVKYYAAFAPMKTVGWTFIVMLPESEVFSTTNALLTEVNNENDELEITLTKYILRMLYSLVIIGIIAAVVVFIGAGHMATSIVRPMNKLTSKVLEIKGDNLDFTWDETTDDETQDLAESFESMTKRMKEYIQEVTQITAEKERIGAELSIATKIQEAMLPNVFPPFPDRNEFDIYATMTPAKEVGGDFFDFFFMDKNHLVVVIADVSGKGVPAAMFMMLTKTMIQNRALMGGTPSEILEFVNNQVCARNEADMFVTVWLAILDVTTGDVIATNAGHEYPAIKKAGGKYEYLKDKHGLPIGAMEGVKYKNYEFKMEPGDAFFVYTDGVTEATNEKEEFWGMDNALAALNKNDYETPQETLAGVQVEITEYMGDAMQFDDITQLCLLYKG
ncbi:sigma-B regulation protein RsbU (phosphoserine phosphatase) [Pseudobutyrivibrio sp. JW11]|uniref:SpoIIE family protein phosphatase n=1 Tax=Pseudobutyrivibrio sp. JW11 TaxID=1855302 RepID=UPI0008E165B0|nr:SpoIIE family protein phosphatase [Pseudobutyrivibrio sp. JW11]SFO12781.1 sigma-B regulation protein RsbU (phosphoserine phosphatase) [Pseudobutyrivibrio sp. JW11]